MQKMKFQNLYEYLDFVFSNKPNPSNEDIKKAKKEYWKLYFQNYHKQRREIRKEFTLGFDATNLARIKKRQGKLTTSKFLYQSIVLALESDSHTFLDRDFLTGLQQKIMLLICNIEEHIAEENKILADIIINQLEVLELEIDEQINTVV
jgi:hypothetical protein